MKSRFDRASREIEGFSDLGFGTILPMISASLSSPVISICVRPGSVPARSRSLRTGQVDSLAILQQCTTIRITHAIEHDLWIACPLATWFTPVVGNHVRSQYFKAANNKHSIFKMKRD